MAQEELGISRVVIDAQKPREIGIVDLAEALVEAPGVRRVDINVTEVDARTETLKIHLEGFDIDVDEVSDILEEHSTVIRSIDAVSAEKKIPEEGK